jgi:hypothetical protein
MGFGTGPEEGISDKKAPISRMCDPYYSEVFHYMADKMLTDVTSIETAYELTLAPKIIEIKAGTIPAGCVVATTLQRTRT